MSQKVILDAIIKREDFECIDDDSVQILPNMQTLNLSELKNDKMIFNLLRKPDFQRETNEWEPEKVCDLIVSFVHGDLIPAVILWKSKSNYLFIIDGSHRLSALSAWVNDDYGDGIISQSFFNFDINDDYKKIAHKTRDLINAKIGKYSNWENMIKDQKKLEPELMKKYSQIATGVIQLQWVNGGPTTAENSFYKINQQQTPLDENEIQLIKNRKKPDVISSRAIIHAGKGHKYWSSFNQDIQSQIETYSKDIHKLLYEPIYKTPIKTLDLPTAYKSNAAQSLMVLYEIINIANKDEKTIDDIDGKLTLQFLKNTKNLLQLFNSNDSGSLGLHPIVYSYSKDGNFKVGSLTSTLSFIKKLKKDNKLKNFIKIRKSFEEFLLNYEDIIQQIIRKNRQSSKAINDIVIFYELLMDLLLNKKSEKDILNEISKNQNFKYIKVIKSNDITSNSNKDFDSNTKSAIFIRDSIKSAIKCPICNSLVHINSISIDHIQRKQDGGVGIVDNGQVTHPYCNTGIKN